MQGFTQGFKNPLSTILQTLAFLGIFDPCNISIFMKGSRVQRISVFRTLGSKGSRVPRVPRVPRDILKSP
jgi:hypothetical protein